MAGVWVKPNKMLGKGEGDRLGLMDIRGWGREKLRYIGGGKVTLCYVTLNGIKKKMVGVCCASAVFFGVAWTGAPLLLSTLAKCLSSLAAGW